MKINLFIFILSFSLLFAKKTSALSQGIKAYNFRAEGAVGFKIQAGPINQALEQFLKAHKNPEKELEAGIYLLKCYYYKGKYLSTDDEQKKTMFSQGKALGEVLINSYPESVGARYWYLVNLGSWAEVYGTLAAAKEGVADLMRDHSNKIIQIDSEYADGGGYFMLGAVNYKSPYIPFILSWPSNDKAIEYLTKASIIGNSTPSQTVYLARALYKDGRKNEARKALDNLLKQPFSTEKPVEDYEQHEEAKKLLKNWE
tara:strand:+ start:380 stop:1150 length:771 start_codon:yes stop_codon:yes gene_type:complete